MAISERSVKNKRNSAGELTGKAGIVYDVNIKYKENGQPKTHTKKGFSTKREAQQYEAAIKNKLSNPSYVPPTAAQRKKTLGAYLDEWIVRHGESNLRPSTYASYHSNIQVHIKPALGDVPLSQLSAAMLDDFYRQLDEKGLSPTSVRYSHRILSVALEHARKYHYIESNPTKDILTKFGKAGKTPAPYTIDEMRQLLVRTAGTVWEMPVVLGGLYGLRLGELLGLRWCHVHLEERYFEVVEQLPFRIKAAEKVIALMAPVKAGERTLPITDATLPYFQRYLERQKEQQRLTALSGAPYYDNDLVICNGDGSFLVSSRVSANFAQLLRRMDMRHIRFHDLRHSAATNLHELSGDFYTVGQILGHSLKGIGNHLGLSKNLDSVTAQYIDVRLDRKQVLLQQYHEVVLGNCIL